MHIYRYRYQEHSRYWLVCEPGQHSSFIITFTSNLYISSNIKHYDDYIELIYTQSDIPIALQITECAIRRSAV
jgi:hypothetical protein